MQCHFDYPRNTKLKFAHIDLHRRTVFFFFFYTRQNFPVRLFSINKS